MWCIYRWTTDGHGSSPARYNLRFEADEGHQPRHTWADAPATLEHNARNAPDMYPMGIYIVVASRGGNWQGGVFRLTWRGDQPIVEQTDTSFGNEEPQGVQFIEETDDVEEGYFTDLDFEGG